MVPGNITSRFARNHSVPVFFIVSFCLILAFSKLPKHGSRFLVYKSEFYSTTIDSLKHLKEINEKLIGPAEYGLGCPTKCGCPQTRVDCPRHYNISDIEDSARFEVSPQLYSFLEKMLNDRHSASRKLCLGLNDSVSGTGGWCLQPGKLWSIVTPEGYVIPGPTRHVKASQQVLLALKRLILTENITSLYDFGAGVGQYGCELLKFFPKLDYQAFDGAGNVQEYTNGFVRFLDLTIPFNLPIKEWVVSLEVGEHVPSRFEGVVIRNLHRHNCKGIVLSWAILGQGGHNHINNHGNDYIEAIFRDLKYFRDFRSERMFRKASDNYDWFTRTSMVFRRHKSSC
ncbi:hypothetical protein GUITHDRAFT_91192 [Guillardia theta CCMP2712]|uniref:Methyltransferase n=2 Tax=Guillardia theta TaxID=55529 RepID=L1I5N8_GUITC|nr:hypothetical protein GUITHDRAFT_91192 [Guillardia theta CCMP2712]EKX31578.1 hypothetical protein GUITHDRAFT_91192 [Guillardia theta CCMP2712]|mmetsp:Transcript_39564/g.124424  ORF Transcript_39564/g.124424 Transcript_39564/m.124424 type:complete len:341 (+) Transcript_39564:127-1149(+)|eukprot:XP_005818558.1 hypothetical protein GUITHDRAFT_91192 [Guillardia theta CCMP2712]